jgi:subtilisin family serine protease
MEQTYTVLRDMSRAGTDEPFGGGIVALDLGGTPAAPRVDREVLNKREVHDISRAPEVRAVAPVMPTSLVRPVADDDAGAAAADDPAPGGMAWGIGAVGADTSSRTGAGVVVAILDTGIDTGHPAFAGVNIVAQDFSGSGNGDRQGHGTHVAGTVFGRDVAGTRIGVARGVTEARIGKVLGDDGSGGSDMLFKGTSTPSAAEMRSAMRRARIAPRVGIPRTTRSLAPLADSMISWTMRVRARFRSSASRTTGPISGEGM